MNNDLRTLIDCRNIWAWLAITGSGTKSSYGPSNQFPFRCPCCKAAGAIIIDEHPLCVNIENRDCSKCLLNGIAWASTLMYDDGKCEEDNSFYNNWEDSYEVTDRQYYAMRMVRACDTAIEQLLIRL